MPALKKLERASVESFVACCMYLGSNRHSKGTPNCQRKRRPIDFYGPTTHRTLFSQPIAPSDYLTPQATSYVTVTITSFLKANTPPKFSPNISYTVPFHSLSPPLHNHGRHPGPRPHLHRRRALGALSPDGRSNRHEESILFFCVSPTYRVLGKGEGGGGVTRKSPRNLPCTVRASG